MRQRARLCSARVIIAEDPGLHVPSVVGWRLGTCAVWYNVGADPIVAIWGKRLVRVGGGKRLNNDLIALSDANMDVAGEIALDWHKVGLDDLQHVVVNGEYKLRLEGCVDDSQQVAEWSGALCLKVERVRGWNG